MEVLSEALLIVLHSRRSLLITSFIKIVSQYLRRKLQASWNIQPWGIHKKQNQKNVLYMQNRLGLSVEIQYLLALGGVSVNLNILTENLSVARTTNTTGPKFFNDCWSE